jgi:hypothetical protein
VLDRSISQPLGVLNRSTMIEKGAQRHHMPGGNSLARARVLGGREAIRRSPLGGGLERREI